MPAIGTSSLMSGEGRRSACATPRLSSTLPESGASGARIGESSSVNKSFIETEDFPDANRM